MYVYMYICILTLFLVYSPPTHPYNHENCSALHFALCCKKIEIEFAHKSKYSEQ